MVHQSDISEVYAAIQRWDDLRKVPSATIPYFDKFTCFVIDQEKLNDWISDVRVHYLHFYLGINENRDLVFYIVTDHHDQPGEFSGEHVYSCINRDFDVETAFNAISFSSMPTINDGCSNLYKLQGYSLLWQLSYKDFLSRFTHYWPEEMFYAFKIKMNELRNPPLSVSTPSTYSADCYVTMGLSQKGSDSIPIKYQPHIVVWNLKVGDSKVYIADLSYPIPPFNQGEYPLSQGEYPLHMAAKAFMKNG